MRSCQGRQRGVRKTQKTVSVFDHPWLGSLFGDAEINTLLSADAQLKRMLQVEVDYARALGAAKVVSAELAKHAMRVAEGFQPNLEQLRTATARDGVVVLMSSQPFPSRNNKRDDLIVNEDGSVDLYFGSKEPEGKGRNWVKTVPGKGWFAILRLYGPLEPWFDRSWRPGDFEPLD